MCAYWNTTDEQLNDPKVKEALELLQHQEVSLNKDEQTLIRYMGAHRTIPGPPIIGSAATEVNQYVFFTRPELNLSASTLVLDRNFHSLNTLNPYSTSFMIRALLDPVFARKHEKLCLKSPLINYYSPFLTPLSNMVTDISGWPEYSLETETSEGGFYGENLTRIRGSDRLARTYDLNIGFQDAPYGPIKYLIIYWLLAADRIAMGDFTNHVKNINQRRLAYSTGIYVINTDPSGNYITSMAKGTLCFPKSFPFGDLFSFSSTERHNTSLNKFSIPFTMNHVLYLPDYLPILMFNYVVEGFAPGVEKAPELEMNATSSEDMTQEGYRLPYIKSTKKGFKLVWKLYGSPPANHGDAEAQALEKALSNLYERTYDPNTNSVITTDQSGQVVTRSSMEN